MYVRSRDSQQPSTNQNRTEGDVSSIIEIEIGETEMTETIGTTEMTETTETTEEVTMHPSRTDPRRKPSWI